MEKKIKITNDNGELKSKEYFLEEMENLYDEIAVPISEPIENKSFFEMIVDPENQIDIDTSLETYGFLDRTIYLVEEISQEDANKIFEMIKFWNDTDSIDKIPIEDRTPIKIYINTPGGDLDAVFSIINSIKISKTPVYTITIGTGYSAGFFIGVCGHKKFGLPYSSYLFHEGASMDSGDAHKFIQKVEFYKTQLKCLKEIVLSNTKITEEMYEKMKKDDWFMDADEALKYNVIDKIITEFKE